MQSYSDDTPDVLMPTRRKVVPIVAKVPPENRFTYQTPNYSKNTTPDPPVSTTSFPMKPKTEGSA